MKNNAELIIEHGKKRVGDETTEVDIAIQEQSTDSEPKPIDEQISDAGESETQESEVFDAKESTPLDDIRSKMMDYPLPTPKISEMAPPTPPQTNLSGA